VILRCYMPAEEIVKQTWPLPDIEKVK